jgi:hypothetical protein
MPYDAEYASRGSLAWHEMAAWGWQPAFGAPRAALAGFLKLPLESSRTRCTGSQSAWPRLLQRAPAVSAGAPRRPSVVWAEYHDGFQAGVARVGPPSTCGKKPQTEGESCCGVVVVICHRALAGCRDASCAVGAVQALGRGGAGSTSEAGAAHVP